MNIVEEEVLVGDKNGRFVLINRQNGFLVLGVRTDSHTNFDLFGSNH